MPKYHFFEDPGRGWCRVERSELETLGISETITSYSYQRKDKVYLEEDRDFEIFLKAMEARGQKVELVRHHTNKQSKIRRYQSYSR